MTGLFFAVFGLPWGCLAKLMKNLLFCLVLAVTSAQAGLIVLQPNTDVTGYGFGSHPSILTLQQKPPEGTLEQGCVAPTNNTGGFSTSGCGLTGIGLVSGNNKYATPTLASLGVTGFADLGLLLNINEPGSSPEVTLQKLVLTLYGGADGTEVMFHDSLALPVDLVGKPGGQGSAGFLITIDPIPGLVLDSSWRVGLAAQIGCTTAPCDVAGQYGTAGGDESFTIASLGGGVPPQETPEPATSALLGGGLIALAWALRRRKAS